MRAYMTSIAPRGPRHAEVQREIALRRLARGQGRVTETIAWPLPNVWVGTSVENRRWTTRIDELRATPAGVRFLSCEPLLSSLGELDLDGIHWVIVGGESGPEHRPIEADWIRSIRDQCAAARVPFLFKQWGGRTSKSGGRTLDGRTHDEYPRRSNDAAEELAAIAS
jgi:protein gp37